MPEVATTTTETTIEQTYKIINLKANNFLKLKAVDITPGTEQVIEITGANGAGKSSVLKAIWAAFANRELTKEISSPIRTGETSGSVSVNLGDLIVTRVWTASDTYLTVENAAGLIYKSPQAMLDKLKTTLTFDPLAFTRMTAKDQRATLIKLLGIDTDSLDTDREIRYNTRTEVNRQLNDLGAQLTLYNPLPVGPMEKISAIALITEIRQAQETNAKREKLLQTVNSYIAKINKLETELTETRALLEVGTTELEKVSEIDIVPLEEKLANIEEENKLIEKRIKQDEIGKKIKELSTKSNDLTEEILQIDEQKKKLIQSAKFPVDGLSFDVSGVLYNGIPMTQISSAEQIKISVAMGMAMKPGLRVMLIQDGSLLDASSRQVIEDLAKQYDMQVWLETVDDYDGTKIVIEDGEVKTE